MSNSADKSALQPHPQWSSRLRFILAATGAAVGLGNIWKFPYTAGDSGGSAFVLLYIVCLFAVGMPVLMAEILLGKLGRCDAPSSMQKLANKMHASPNWGLIGWLGAFTLILVLSFYSVVAGWSLAYIYYAISGHFSHASASDITHLWQHLLASPGLMLLLHAGFMTLTVSVVAKGVQAGLERASSWLMPALFAILILLVGYAASTQGFSASWHFLFDFNLNAINAHAVLAALGQAFFSLAVGAGCMLVYGAYLPAQARIGEAVITITGLNLLVAILAGLAIFALVFTYHLPASEGPGLMFQTLPLAFAQMGGGRLFGCLFFVLLLFAAWTSSISMAEPLVALLISKRQLDRVQAACWVGGFAWLVGIASVLSFNRWSQVRILQHWSIFSGITDLTTNILLPLGALGYAIFAGWKLRSNLAESGLQLRNAGLFKLWRFLIRTIAPAGIVIIVAQAITH